MTFDRQYGERQRGATNLLQTPATHQVCQVSILQLQRCPCCLVLLAGTRITQIRRRSSRSPRTCRPEAVDPRLHPFSRSVVGCLSYLVNMTRPDLVLTYSQLNKFVQSPRPVHLAAAKWALSYLDDEGITYFDPGPALRNNLTGWVNSDFAADQDTRKPMTGYIFIPNGGAVSCRSSRQGGVTLSSAEAEFVEAS